MITAQDGAVVSGRTMEFGFDLESNVLVFPAGTQLTGTLQDGGPGISYTTEHGFIGANALGYDVVVDGINEKGLYLSILYFPGWAAYNDVTSKSVNAASAMAPHELGNWVLGTCATIEDVRARIGTIVLCNTAVPALGGPGPIHLIVRDPSGKSLVVEPLEGKLKIYDNPVGVLTNSPPFDWHLTNLRNYSGLRAENLKNVLLGGGLELPQLGQGNGLFGLPGDSTPPSRFVRAVAYSQTALKSATGPDAVLQVFHIMNNFDIPIGSVRETIEQAPAPDAGKRRSKHGDTAAPFHAEFTSWTTAADLTNRRWYFRTYNDQSIRMIEIDKTLAAVKSDKSLKPGTRPIIAMDSKQPIIDTSTNFLTAVAQ
jgi:choloylglycine hydrolase